MIRFVAAVAMALGSAYTVIDLADSHPALAAAAMACGFFLTILCLVAPDQTKEGVSP